MKRTFFFTLLSLCFLLCACAGPQAPSDETVQGTEKAEQSVLPVTYDFMNADWLYYNNATELLEVADFVFLARAEKIDFAILDDANVMPVSDSTKSKFLNTLYELEIEKVFKGDVSRVRYLNEYGGKQGINEEKQIRLQREHGLISAQEAYIPIMGSGDSVDLPLGRTLLFVGISAPNPEMVLIVNPDQSIYSLDAPTEPQSQISVQDILTELGEDVWQDFIDSREEADTFPAEFSGTISEDAPTDSPVTNEVSGTAPPIATEKIPQ